ncbi:protein FAM234A isoform 2-T2 [Vipera latastei]
MATARARPLPALAGRHTRRRLAGDVTATGGGAVRRRVRGGASGWLASGRVQSAVRPMARPEAETEIHLLKAREAPASPGTGARDAEKEAGGGGAQPGRLSQWRTAAFFLSLYLCLGLAFAFSFVIPCPVRPASRTAWSRAYDDAAAYAFLTAGDADGDRVQDVLVAFQAGAGSRNTSGAGRGSCSEGGFAPPCAFLAAHSGTNGTTLWERPVGQELLLMDCSVEHGGSPACLVIGNPASFVLLDLETGQTQWNETAIFGPNSTVLSPLLKIPDIDRDGVPDFLVFAVTGEETKSFFFSGTFGTQKKFSGSLHLPGLIGHFLHITKSGAHYILFYTGSFCLLAEGAVSHGCGPNKPSPCQPEGRCGLGDGDSSQGPTSALSQFWRHSVRDKDIRKTREPYFGCKISYVGAGEWTTAEFIVDCWCATHPEVTIVEGSSGAIKWEVELLSEMQSPKPASLATADRRSIFLFWGLYQDERNETGSWHGSQQQRLYLFHPSLPTVLLELSNSTEPIVAFEGLLFERSRHACYVLLVGPQVGSSPGRVILSKRKLKEDIFSSHVIWLNQMPQDTDQNVRDYFHRMRFRTFG